MHSVTLQKLPPHRTGQAKKDEEVSSQIPQLTNDSFYLNYKNWRNYITY